MKFFLSLFVAIVATLAAEAQCSNGSCSSSGAGLFGRGRIIQGYQPAYSYAQPTVNYATAPVRVTTSEPAQQIAVGTRAPETHTHTCQSCQTTWDHKSNPVGQGDVGHTCPNCKTVQKVQDSSPRPVTVFQTVYKPAVAVQQPKHDCPECEKAERELKTASTATDKARLRKVKPPEGCDFYQDDVTGAIYLLRNDAVTASMGLQLAGGWKWQGQ